MLTLSIGLNAVLLFLLMYVQYRRKKVERNLERMADNVDGLLNEVIESRRKREIMRDVQRELTQIVDNMRVTIPATPVPPECRTVKESFTE
jgi:uncharacterized membrane protein